MAEQRSHRRPVCVVTLVIVLLVVPCPDSVWALCPNCLGQRSTVSPTLEIIGLFLLLPFLVAYFVLRAIRRAGRNSPTPRPADLARR